MEVYTKPEQRRKGGVERRGEKDKIKLIDLRFHRWSKL